ncbi:SLC41A family transporter [Paracraurococcus lichenis]|uniref:Magnesium transporter n=1 Tax=Paracraurococcus lichenis TaxID=3064888 RepID=A0ABT9E2U0_9PROT|nr:magnesium transporter [Paracraurococcus sp. LOR1-02]MDO9710481.1 magnesium transporter [Paracraurococcus sp. LOR1-02]
MSTTYYEVTEGRVIRTARAWLRTRLLSWFQGRLWPPQEDTACRPVEYVRGLQSDLRILTRYVARRDDLGFKWQDPDADAKGRAAPAPPATDPGPAAPGSATSGSPAPGFATPGPTADRSSGPVCDEKVAKLLTACPEEIARDARLLAALVHHTDILSRHVRPANVSTIRLTCAYVDTHEHGPMPPQVVQEARSVRRFIRAMALLGLFALILAVHLLVHAGNGERILGDLEAQRKALSQAEAAVATAQRDAAANLPAERREEALRGGAESICKATAPLPPPPVAKACLEREQALQGLRVTRERLVLWNGTTDNLARWTLLYHFVPEVRPPGDLPSDAWSSAEARTKGGLFGLTAFVLPMLLGLVGACAFMYQRISRKIELWTLEARDKWRSVLRVLLGFMLGGLVGALWTSGESVEMEGGVTLSLAAIAFFVGYAVKMVFDTIEAIIAAVLAKVSLLFGKPDSAT